MLNEERALPGCVAVLHAYLDDRFPFDWTITIVDNGSTDSTRAIADDIAGWCPRVRTIGLGVRGKGRAVRAAWATSEAEVVAYMDVDLSTGLDALLPLVAPLANGHSDVAVGSRLAPGARTVRGARRELISHGYNAALRLAHGARFSDAQCGFKAARTTVIRPLLGGVADDSWFFDTELLLLAEHNDLRVHEVPVDWVEDVDSRVDIVGTAATNLRGMARMMVSKATGAARVPGLPGRGRPEPEHPDAELATHSPRVAAALSFGTASVIALGVYSICRTWLPPLLANAVAIGLTARLLPRRALAPRHLLTSAALLGAGAGRLPELAALLAAGLVGTAAEAATAGRRRHHEVPPARLVGRPQAGHRAKPAAGGREELSA